MDRVGGDASGLPRAWSQGRRRARSVAHAAVRRASPESRCAPAGRRARVHTAGHGPGSRGLPAPDEAGPDRVAESRAVLRRCLRGRHSQAGHAVRAVSNRSLDRPGLRAAMPTSSPRRTARWSRWNRSIRRRPAKTSRSWISVGACCAGSRSILATTRFRYGRRTASPSPSPRIATMGCRGSIVAARMVSAVTSG